MANQMKAKDSVSGSLAECYITISGERYNFMQLYNFEATFDVNVSEIPILGRTMRGHKATYCSGSWSGTAHYNQSIFRKVWLEYKRTGDMPYFDIQVTNEDPTSSIGRQTIILKECLSEGGPLAKYDADAEYLDEELSGTFDDWEMPETFKVLDGMK